MTSVKTMKALLVCLLLIPAAASASTIGFNDRYQTVTPASSTDELTLDFPITNTGDLTILVDGTETTDFTVTATFSDGVATGATVNINTPVVSNPTIEIIGTREPSRTQFTVASGQNLVGKINAEIAQRAIEIQELYRDLGRSLKFPYGDSVDPTLGDVSTRANKYLLFDSSGLPTFTGSTPADAAEPIPTRTAVQTATIDSSVNLIRTGGYASEGDGGGASYKRVVSEPSHALKVQSADGAWWELVPDPMGISVKQAGAKGDGTTDDSQAFIDAINGVKDLNASGVNKATHRVIVPGSEDEYYLAGTTLELKRVVHIMGAGSGLDNTPKPSVLRWDANTTGFIVHTFNTTGATTEGTGTGSGGGSIIEGLHLDSDGGTIAGVTDDTKGNGVWLRGRALLRNLRITDFPGNCINIVAAVGGSGGITEGNANGWRIDGARLFGCHQNGVFVTGADSNAGVGQGIDVSGCGRAGIADHSFLGNTWIAPEVESCGIANQGENGAAESSYVDFGGTRYIANRTATEAELVANQPGTDKTVWIPVGAGSANITWQASQPEGTYFVGGSYVASAGNSIIVGAYHEEGQARPQVAGMMVGGLHQNNFDGGGVSQTFNEWTGGFTWGNEKTFPETDLDKELTLGFWQDNQRPIRVVADGDNAVGLSLGAWDDTGGRFVFHHANDPWMYVTSDLTTSTYGRASAFASGYPVFERGLVLGSFSGARHMTNGTAAPTSGEHARGEFVWNQEPSVDGNNMMIIGWLCVSGGTPGTWQPMYASTVSPAN